LEGEVAVRFFAAVLSLDKIKRPLSSGVAAMLCQPIGHRPELTRR
jgi:hypothetical protein